MDIQEIKNFIHDKFLMIVDEPSIEDGMVTLITSDDGHYSDVRILQSLFAESKFRDWRFISVDAGITNFELLQNFPPRIFEIKFIKK